MGRILVETEIVEITKIKCQKNQNENKNTNRLEIFVEHDNAG